MCYARRGGLPYPIPLPAPVMRMTLSLKLYDMIYAATQCIQEKNREEKQGEGRCGEAVATRRGVCLRKWG